MTGTVRASDPPVKEPDSDITAGSEIGLENTLKVEHGFEPHWDYQGKRIVGVLFSNLVNVQTGHAKALVKHAGQAEPPGSRPASVPQTTSPRHETGHDRALPRRTKC
jgi:hypothetical protein